MLHDVSGVIVNFTGYSFYNIPKVTMLTEQGVQ